MLCNNKFIFNESVAEYLSEREKFISNRLENINLKDHVTINTIKKNGRRKIDSIDFHIENQKFKSNTSSKYSVRIKEKIFSLNKDNSYTDKFSYQISNDRDSNDFIRFDFFPYDDFPPLHINSCDNIWGNHLTYPETTNINLECLDSLKALSIFEKFIHHPEKHILDQRNNKDYINILEAK